MGKDNESIPHRVPMIILVAPQSTQDYNTPELGAGLTKSEESHAQKPNHLAGIPNLLGLPLDCCSSPDQGVASLTPHESAKYRSAKWT